MAVATGFDEAVTTYADPTRCPGCSAPITYGASGCAACGLSLTGPVAQQLFVTLTEADRLVSVLRAGGTGGAVTASAPGAAVGAPAATVATPQAPAQSPGQSPRPSSLSVSKILLGLGVLSLCVAATVFLAVAWSVLGVAGRTAVLIALTVLAGGATLWLARKRLRAAAESVSLLFFLLLVLDVIGAESSGWLGDIPDSGLVILIGALLVVAPALVTLYVRRSTTRDLIGAQVVTAAGTLVIGSGIASGSWSVPAGRFVVAVLIAAAIAAALLALRLVLAALASAAAALVLWFGLLITAIVEMSDESSFSYLWGEFAAWPGVAAAALMAIVVPVTQLPQAARHLCASLAVGTAVLTATAVSWDESATVVGIVLAAVVIAAAAALYLPESTWPATYLTALIAATGSGLVTFLLAAACLDRITEAAAETGAATDRFGAVDGSWPAPWLLVLSVAALLLLAYAASRPLRNESIASLVLQWSPAALAAAGLLALAGYDVPISLVMAVALVVGAGFALVGQLWPALGALILAAITSCHHTTLSSIAFIALVALLLAGVAVRRSAPIVAGAAAAALIAVRQVAPVIADHVHPWIIFGVIGAILVALGVTWEARLRDAQRVGDYLRRLR